MFIDTHVHFDDFQEDGSIADLLERAKEAKVSQMIAVGGSIESNNLAISLAESKQGQIFAAVGLNRDLANSSYDLSACKEQALNPLVLAIGEVGLDYFYDEDTADCQKKLFAEMLQISAETSKPVVVHARDADDDSVALLSDFNRAWKGSADKTGVIHCFTRGRDFAKKVLDLGLYISFSGIVTFRNADDLREIVKYVPEDRILIETDSPYLAPIPMRGKRNEPCFVPYVAAQIAQIKNMSVEQIAYLTSKNASDLFGFALTNSLC